jgi:hypothetical protein
MRRLALLGLVLILMAACGGGGNSTSTTESAATTSTSTSQPTATTAAATTTTAATATPVATATESTGTAATPSSSASPTEQASAGLPTTDQLKTALLELSDMPDGWTASADSGGDTSTSSTCNATATPTADNEVTVSVDFQKSDLGPFVTEQITAFPAGQMQSEFEKLKQSIANCTQWTETDSEGTPTTYQLTPLTLPKMGDDSIAYRLSADSGGLTFQADTVFIRVGDYGISLANVALDGVDSDLTASTAQKAVDKVNAFSQ